MALSAVLILAIFAFSLQSCTDASTNGKEGSQNESSESNSATLVVNLPDASPFRIESFEISEELSVRDFMVKVAEKHNDFHFTDTLYTGMGHLLTSLQGIANAKGEGAYWQFCIDNTASDRGIDEKTIHSGQQVDWHYVQYGKLPCKKIGE